MDDQAFKDHMWNFNKYGFTLVSLVFGHELGLFDVMKNAKKRLSSTELASLAGMKERCLCFTLFLSFSPSFLTFCLKTRV